MNVLMVAICRPPPGSLVQSHVSPSSEKWFQTSDMSVLLARPIFPSAPVILWKGLIQPLPAEFVHRGWQLHCPSFSQVIVVSSAVQPPSLGQLMGSSPMHLQLTMHHVLVIGWLGGGTPFGQELTLVFFSHIGMLLRGGAAMARAPMRRTVIEAVKCMVDID